MRGKAANNNINKASSVQMPRQCSATQRNAAHTLKEGSIASDRPYASVAASGSPSCPLHKPIMFQSTFESIIDLTTSPKSTTARLKYRSCERGSSNQTKILGETNATSWVGPHGLLGIVPADRSGFVNSAGRTRYNFTALLDATLATAPSLLLSAIR